MKPPQLSAIFKKPCVRRDETGFVRYTAHFRELVVLCLYVDFLGQAENLEDELYFGEVAAWKVVRRTIK